MVFKDLPNELWSRIALFLKNQAYWSPWTTHPLEGCDEHLWLCSHCHDVIAHTIGIREGDHLWRLHCLFFHQDHTPSLLFSSYINETDLLWHVVYNTRNYTQNLLIDQRNTRLLLPAPDKGWYNKITDNDNKNM